MTYQECLDFLYRQLPMYQRDGSSAFKKDLSNTIALCDALGQPQHHFRSVHVAGTNGKGSTCHLLAAILQAEGYKVGLYTSPHYFDFRERIKINGHYISKQAVVGFVRRTQDLMLAIEPSFFELTVAMAFDYFARQKVDFAIIETGLGGRLDSTNVIKPLVSVITNIGYDHQSMLGNTLQLIAGEKAGIIKPEVPVVIGERQPETTSVFIEKARELHAPIFFADELITLNGTAWKSDHFITNVEVRDDGDLNELRVGLLGPFQETNIRTVLAAINVLCDRKDVCVSEESLRQGCSMVTRMTRMQGRWQKLRQNPLVIADSGHNVDGLRLSMSYLDKVSKSQLRVVFGISRDKDVQEMLALLPKDAIYYWCAADLPRSLPSGDLEELGNKLDLTGLAFDSVAQALEEAIESAGKDDLIFVGGSSFVVGEVLPLRL
ncbi:MAG: bifunctional folylpolyglutamate synthase/dihydrofolate synthase [Saprospiraceae bacterium]|nr:bifunctional folylpolyglutamate synthase/dihydrofolate synthase [Saprospiraceae bacterium]